MKERWWIVVLVVAGSVVAGCAESHVRDGPSPSMPRADAALATVLGPPCIPTFVPEGGFSSAEVSVETYTPVCGEPPFEGVPTRPPIGVCVVYELDGDPRPGCTSRCAGSTDVAVRTFCSCRCDGDPGTGPFCSCPSGARCERLIEHGGWSGGSFCVPGTLTPR